MRGLVHASENLNKVCRFPGGVEGHLGNTGEQELLTWFRRIGSSSILPDLLPTMAQMFPPQTSAYTTEHSGRRNHT